jgi:branched-chain amino acid transport system ATP-binding protein
MKTIYLRFPRLDERRNQRAKTLSGGEQQMLVIGRALMAEPSLLIFDEPSLGLAPRIVDDVFEIINELNVQQKLSVLLIEQNIARALEIASRAYVLENGSITIAGTSVEVSNNEHVKRAYLGM